MAKFEITYIKTKTIVIDETTLIIEDDNANSAVVKGYEQLGWSDWDLDTCKEIKDSGVIE